MDKKADLAQVVDVLKKEGLSTEQITKIIEDLTKTAWSKFYTESLAVFSPEDLKAIEECTSQEEANFEIRTRYAEKTGKNPDTAMLEFLNTFAQGFLDQYYKDKAEKKTTQT